MRIGSPSMESVLITANLAVALCLGVGYLVPDLREGPPPDDGLLREVPRRLVVVVAGGRPVDAAVGQTAAWALGGSVLSVPPGGPTAAIRDELVRASPDRVLVLGGPSVVSEASVRALEELTSGPVTRLSGGDRFDTAAAVATSEFRTPVVAVRIASGDGVVAAPAAPASGAGGGGPLLLVHADRIPASAQRALRQLQPRRIEVVGGPSGVPDSVVQQLQSYTAGEVTRVAASS